MRGDLATLDQMILSSQWTNSERVLVLIGKEAAKSLLVLRSDGDGLESFPDLSCRIHDCEKKVGNAVTLVGC